ncbi:MAG TPA: deaminase [Actinobacteria bacterium]|nr:deaminase [Actinomycetota bacterium]
MSRLRIHNLTVSLDGYVAGPGQSLEYPLGRGSERLHDWAFATRTFRAMHGMDGGATGIDDDFAAAGQAGIGATIMGRNMFGPIRGPWGSPEWRGWWGENPPYHHPVFVLTHHPRPPLTMEGGTTFHFVTGGVQEALDQAAEAAADRDILIGGGANTVQQYLRAGLVDEMHLAIVPVILGGGARLFDDVAGMPGYEPVALAASASAMHVKMSRIGS